MNLLQKQVLMMAKSYYINVLSSLFLAALVFFIGLTANWHLLSSSIFSIVLMIYFLWLAIKKFKERNQEIIFDYKKVLATIGLMLLILGILIFIATNFK